MIESQDLGLQKGKGGCFIALSVAECLACIAASIPRMIRLLADCRLDNRLVRQVKC